MQVRYGRIAGIEKPVPRLIQGTMWFRANDADAARAVLDTAFELGCTALDTAHVYGAGESERIVGQWIHERAVRDQVVIIGKGCEPNPDRSRVTAFDVTADLQDSLARLRTDHIDLYLVHVDDPGAPVAPIVDVLNEHLQAGRISAYGVSNWSHLRITEANAYAAANGLRPIAASSVNLSLAEQVRPPWPGNLSIGGEAGRTAREWYAGERLPLLAWSSLAGGFFSGRFTRSNWRTFDEYFARISAETYCTEDNFRRLDRATELGSKSGRTAAQVALAWILAQPMEMFALVGSATPKEVRSNVGAFEISLSAAEIAWLAGAREAV